MSYESEERYLSRPESSRYSPEVMASHIWWILSGDDFKQNKLSIDPLTLKVIITVSSVELFEKILRSKTDNIDKVLSRIVSCRSDLLEESAVLNHNISIALQRLISNSIVKFEGGNIVVLRAYNYANLDSSSRKSMTAMKLDRWHEWLQKKNNLARLQMMIWSF